MRLSLHELKSATEFPPVIHSEWLSHATPYNPVFTLFCPILGTHPTAREEAIQASTTRQYEAHIHDPASHWIKAIDNDDNGKVVGAAIWYIHETDPYSKPLEQQPLTCFWWPDGPKRVMADEMLGQMAGSRMEKMSKPHMFADLRIPSCEVLEACWVLPEYRCRGIGTLLLQWGLERADQLGLGTFLESTEIGRSLYAKNGFTILKEIHWEPTPPEATDELVKLQVDLTFHGYLMWRPANDI